MNPNKSNATHPSAKPKWIESKRVVSSHEYEPSFIMLTSSTNNNKCLVNITIQWLDRISRKSPCKRFHCCRSFHFIFSIYPISNSHRKISSLDVFVDVFVTSSNLSSWTPRQYSITFLCRLSILWWTDVHLYLYKQCILGIVWQAGRVNKYKKWWTVTRWDRKSLIFRWHENLEKTLLEINVTCFSLSVWLFTDIC